MTHQTTEPASERAELIRRLRFIGGETCERAAALLSTDAKPVVDGELPITDAMVTAYLEANERYWLDTDKLPKPPDRWRTGNPRDATRAGLAAALLAAKPAAGGGEAVAWMRRWAFDGEEPRKEKKDNGRLAWPAKFKLLPVTNSRLLDDDVPLYTNPKPKPEARRVPDGWKLVPSIGTSVKANHPITCLNPDEWFEVTEVRAESDGRFAVRGERTCWFGLSMLSAAAAPKQPEDGCVPLTPEQAWEIWTQVVSTEKTRLQIATDLVRVIEAAHGITEKK